MFFAKSPIKMKSEKQTSEKETINLDDVTQEHEAIYGDRAVIEKISELQDLRDHSYKIAQ